ncbi:MAG TPA: hypothetical protein RMH85_13440 [Polyangiaceae bacterium LLY-WYZ-15_(1-7)]|nr:hypothetical protein [Myxococcales bacterium]MAT27784.1 hypothetical protein [Sandaracinus sp.]HJK94833.1 hypothetical protein [Polyangiaceae bacterium LLY-WYZ-15_(1-7)]HJL00104.1 hypothetical protein [Polyangiaceae bacterium LLY-WYZ-15_(1-7)]HJL09501.1 hypothetical protein [Polyangiaceae bacterium LLY-WYZ-15_(1-7)]
MRSPSDTAPQAPRAAERPPLWDDPSLPMRAMPALTLLALAAALLDLLGNRVVLRVATDREVSGLSHGTLVDLSQGGAFVRNLTALAGLGALGFALSEFLQPKPQVGLAHRIAMAGFAGIFLPTIFLAAVLPPERTTSMVVLFAAGAANVIGLLLGFGAAHWKVSLPLRVGLGAAASTAFFGFASLVFLIVAALTLWESGYPLGMGLRRAGEVAYLVLLACLLAASWPRDRRPRVQAGLALLALALAGVLAWGFADIAERVTTETFRDLLYGAVHAELFAESAPALYVGFVAAGIGAGVAGLFSGSPVRRQAAAALLFLVAAGYAPTTPLTLLLFALAVTLLARAAIAGSTLRWLREVRSDDLMAIDRELDAELAEAEGAKPSEPPGEGARDAESSDPASR